MLPVSVRVGKLLLGCSNVLPGQMCCLGRVMFSGCGTVLIGWANVLPRYIMLPGWINILPEWGDVLPGLG